MSSSPPSPRGRPPRLASWLLRLALAGAERDALLGDLHEEYTRRHLPRRGKWGADLWYWSQVLRSLGPALTLSRNVKGTLMTSLFSDVRLALRLFLRSPGLALTIVLTIGIGVGGATAVFSVVRGVLLTPLSFPDSDRVVGLWGQTPDYAKAPLTVGDFNDVFERARSFEAHSVTWSNSVPLIDDADPEQVSVGWVTPAYFDVVRVEPSLGRRLKTGDENGVVLSHGLWARRYGSDPDVIGRVVTLGGGSMEILGVLPADLNPNLTSLSGSQTDFQVWRLMPRDWLVGTDRSVGWLRPVAIVSPGVSVQTVQQEVDAIVADINASGVERDGGPDFRVNVTPARTDLVGRVSSTLWLLLAAVGGVLLIAASNVAHLMLARAHTRGNEVAVRTALGARRGRLIRQFLVESSLLGFAGGIAGVGLAWVGVRLLTAWAPSTLPRLDAIAIDAPVLFFALTSTLVAAMVFGVVPSLRATQTDLTSVMGERSSSGDRRRHALSRGLVVAEVALSLTLLVGTGLLLRSLERLNSVDLGFRTEDILTFSLSADGFGDTAEEGAAKLTDYLTRLGAIPGAQAVGFTNRIPLGGGIFTGTVRSEEVVAAGGETVETSLRYVTPGYLTALGVRIVAGRGLRQGEGLEVVVIDQMLADHLWPGQNAVGRRIEQTGIGQESAWAEVVGVVASMKHDGVSAPARPTILLPMLALAHQQGALYGALRVTGDPLLYVERVEAAVRPVDATTVVAQARSMSQLFNQSVDATRFGTLLLGVFGVIALVLSAVGLYGVMSFSIRERTREIGIRVALGAQARDVLRNLVASGVGLVAAGVAVGLLLSLAAGRALEAVLFEVTATDGATLVVASVAMLVVGLIGAYLPARLVLAMNPVQALRDE